MSIDVTQLNNYREGNRIEAKEAQCGLPKSIWETYSSFSNTNGGVILLGVKELPDKSLNAIGLPNPEDLIKEFWDNLNNPQKVSSDTLIDKNVSIIEDSGIRIITIDVPRADRHTKPIYIGPDPFKGSYRRNGEGDYRCTRDEVRGMFRDSADETQD